MTTNKKQIWFCKIGEASDLPPGSDAPMREAVQRAYRRITGEYPLFIFSGWGSELSVWERACHENREPTEAELATTLEQYLKKVKMIRSALSLSNDTNPGTRERDALYESFWKDDVETDGALDLEKVKFVLEGYANQIDAVNKVYDAITGGQLSKANTDPDVVIEEAERFALKYLSEYIKEGAELIEARYARLAHCHVARRKQYRATRKALKKSEARRAALENLVRDTDMGDQACCDCKVPQPCDAEDTSCADARIRWALENAGGTD